MRQAVPQHIPVTAKIRLGYDERVGYLENATAIYEAGATELVVHARSKSDGYKPPAYWHLISEIQNILPIPVIANGEIWSEQDFIQCRDESGCHDFMLGRGILARPDLALAIKAYGNNENYEPIQWSTIANHLLDFFELTTEAYPQKFLGNRTKQWLFYLQRQYPQAYTLFQQIKRSREYTEIKHAILNSVDNQSDTKTFDAFRGAKA